MEHEIDETQNSQLPLAVVFLVLNPVCMSFAWTHAIVTV